MSTTRGFLRPEHPEVPPKLPGGEHVLASPPEVPHKTPVSMLQFMTPVLMVLMVVGMGVAMFTMGSPGGGRVFSPYMLAFPMMMVIGVMVMASNSVGGGSQVGELNESRKEFLWYLGIQRRRVQDTGRCQHAARAWGNPEPAVLPSLVGTARMWEQRTTSSTFGHVRVGLGTELLATKLQPAKSAPVHDLEPVTARFLKRFMDIHKAQSGIALAVALRSYPFLRVTDSDAGEAAAALTRSMLCELSLFHGPDHVLVAVITEDPEDERWSWVKWLPHNQHPSATDGLGTARMVYPDVASAHEALASITGSRKHHRPDIAESVPHLVIVCDRGSSMRSVGTLIGREGIDGVTLIDLNDGTTSGGVKPPFHMTIRDGLLHVPDEKGGRTKFAAPDAVSVAFAADLARMLSRYRPASEMDIIERQVRRKVSSGGLLGYLGVKDAASADPAVLQRHHERRDFLRLPIGVTAADEVVHLDLKEAAESGTGPHGVLIGSTGSGKSQTLRTLVLVTLLTHPSDRLNMLLIDYKGGSAFLGFERAPHVSAVLTNMEAEAHLVARMDVAIRGEFNRRQEIFRATAMRPDVNTDVDNITVYNQLRDAGVALAPLPVLIIVVDEFSALIADHKEYKELFAFIGQQGRSFGIHLLLSSQELGVGHMESIKTHLSYRIALRTNEARLSQEILGVADAYDLDREPGWAILKDVSKDFTRFRAFHTGMAYVPPKVSAAAVEAVSVAGVADQARPQLFTAGAPAKGESDEVPSDGGHSMVVAAPGASALAVPAVAAAPIDSAAVAAESAPVADVNTKTVALVLIDRLAGHGPDAHRIWLPPLNTVITVKQLLSDPDLWWPADRPRGPLRIPVGVIDTPYYQRRELLIVDLMAHNALVTGSSQSGVSTMLQTLVMSAAATHSSREIQFYCLDFSNGKLSELTDLAHVGSVAQRAETALASRIVAEMMAIWTRRQKLFTEATITTMADFRRRKAQGDPALKSDNHGDVVLIIDGWTTITRDETAGLQHLEDKVELLASQAKSYGIHVVLSSSAYMDYKPRLKERFGHRLELRLNEPPSSEVSRKAAERVPAMPGRGIIKSSRPGSADPYNPEILDLLIATPILTSLGGGQSLSTDLGIDVSDSIVHINESNPFKAIPVQLMPTDLARSQFMPLALLPAPPAARAQLSVPLGVGETEMAPKIIDFNDDASPHFAVIGDKGCGKTTLLRHVVTTLCENNPAGQDDTQGVYLLIVDFQRRLLGVLPHKGYGAYATNSDELKTALDHLEPMLSARLPGRDITPGQLRRRDWWSGADIFVVIDNAHELGGGGGYEDKLAPLKAWLSKGRDVGLHVIGTWRCGGVTSHLYGRGLLAELKDLRTAGMVMSGSKDEGKLLGELKATELPPGRGTMVTSDFVELIQVPNLPASDDDLQ